MAKVKKLELPHWFESARESHPKEMAGLLDEEVQEVLVEDCVSPEGYASEDCVAILRMSNGGFAYVGGGCGTPVRGSRLTDSC